MLGMNEIPKGGLLVQSTVLSKDVVVDANSGKKSINWLRLLVGIIIIGIGLAVYLNWDAQLDNQLKKQVVIVNG